MADELVLSEDGEVRIRDPAQRTVLMCAAKGGGKTYAIAVMAEECVRQGLRYVIIDPIGALKLKEEKGERSQPENEAHLHEDVLQPGKGGDLADVMMGRGKEFDYVLDLSHMGQPQRVKFVDDLSERLLQNNDTPRLIIVDEIHEIAPQKVARGQTPGSAQFIRLATLGRNKGPMGVVMCTQRLARVHTDARELADVIIMGKTIGALGMEAAEKQLKMQLTDKKDRHRVLGRIQTLETGEVFFYDPSAVTTKTDGGVDLKLVFSRIKRLDGHDGAGDDSLSVPDDGVNVDEEEGVDGVLDDGEGDSSEEAPGDAALARVPSRARAKGNSNNAPLDAQEAKDANGTTEGSEPRETKVGRESRTPTNTNPKPTLTGQEHRTPTPTSGYREISTDAGGLACQHCIHHHPGTTPGIGRCHLFDAAAVSSQGGNCNYYEGELLVKRNLVPTATHGKNADGEEDYNVNIVEEVAAAGQNHVNATGEYDREIYIDDDFTSEDIGGLTVHEVTENEAMAQGLSQPQAHEIADEAERAAVGEVQFKAETRRAQKIARQVQGREGKAQPKRRFM